MIEYYNLCKSKILKLIRKVLVPVSVEVSYGENFSIVIGEKFGVCTDVTFE